MNEAKETIKKIEQDIKKSLTVLNYLLTLKANGVEWQKKQ
jgi:hypothetical protein